MSLRYEISLYSFTVLTMLCILILGYTIYLTFGISWATHKFEVSILDVTISEDTNETSFLLTVYNPSYIHLNVVLLRVKAYHNSVIMSEIMIPFKNFSLSPNARQNLIVTMNSQSHGSNVGGVWTLDLTFYINAPLLERARIPRLTSKQVEV